MSSLVAAFQKILPVFFLIALGYGLRRTRFMSDDFIKGLSQFVFYVLIPPLMFLSVAKESLKNSFDPVIIFPTMSCLVLFCGILFLMSGTRLPPSQQGVFTQGASRSNLILVGLPILENLYGESVLGPIVVFIAFHALLNNLLSVLVLVLPHHSWKEVSSWKRMAGQVIINPVILGCAAGMAFTSAELTLPTILEKTLQGLCNAAIPLALLIVGASLPRAPMRGQVRLVGFSCLLKLLLFPLCIYFVLDWLDVSKQGLLISVVLLGSPTAAISQIMAKEMKGDESLASSIVTMTTLLSPFTLSVWISLLF